MCLGGMTPLHMLEVNQYSSLKQKIVNIVMTRGLTHSGASLVQILH